MELFGIKLIGADSDTLRKLLLSVVSVGLLLLLRWLVVLAALVVSRAHRNSRGIFWVRQGASLGAALLAIVVLLSIWFDDPRRLTTAIGLVAAGVAVAAQRVITALAGYAVIMRGKTFTVGDRIKMGGVRGDVIALGFLQTRILEMGQPPDVNEQEDPGMWVRARQFSGRIVTITNDKVFDEPVYNFTREFPFIWEEMTIPIKYDADRARAEAILYDAVRHATADIGSESEEARARIQRVYGVELDRHEPRVFWRLTDNWLELTVRFLVRDHGVREVKDVISRAVLEALEASGIQIASATFEIVGLPPVRLQRGVRAGQD